MVHIPHPNAHVFKIAGQILCHLFGQGGHQHPLSLFGAGIDFRKQVVDLSIHRAHVDLRVDQTGRSDDLLDDAGALFLFKGAGRCTDKDDLIEFPVKFIEGQRAVIKGGRQAEAVIHQIFFARLVAAVHSSHLRQGDVRLVHKQQKILREVIEQGIRAAARRTTGKDAGIVFDALAKADFGQHLHIIVGALHDALRLNQLVVGFKVSHSLLHLLADFSKRLLHLLPRYDIMGRRVDGNV